MAIFFSTICLTSAQLPSPAMKKPMPLYPCVTAARIAWSTVGTLMLAPATIHRTSPSRELSTLLAVSAPFCTDTQYGLLANPIIAIFALM